MAGTCLVVWHKHGPVLCAGGFGFRRFWREVWREMDEALLQTRLPLPKETRAHPDPAAVWAAALEVRSGEA